MSTAVYMTISGDDLEYVLSAVDWLLAIRAMGIANAAVSRKLEICPRKVLNLDY